MKKLILVALAVAALGAGVALLVRENDDAGGAAPRDAAAPDEAATAVPQAADKSPDAAKKTRAREQAAPTATLAVSGVVKSPDGKPVSGAVVEAFAVPTGEDISDEERVGRPILVKMFGKQAGDRMWTKTKGLRDAAAAGGTVDPQKALEAAPEMMSAGMEMLSDEAGMDAIMTIMGLAREAIVADDAPWTRVGGAATGADGAFRIEGLAAGRVELRAKAPLHVKTKTRANAGDANVSIQLVRGARLAGVVTCEKEPVVGAVVVVKGARTTSGAGGRFEFDAAHVPMETLIVTAPDCVGQGRMVALSLDFPSRDVAVDLEPAGSIAGHVSSAAGGLVAGARVTVGAGGMGLMELMQIGMSMGSGNAKFDIPPLPAVTDANGAFEIHGVKTGDVKVRVEADGYLSATLTVEVKKGQTAPVTALLVGESVLAGTVKDDKGAPVAGAKIKVEVAARDPMIGMVASMMAGGTWRSAYADDKGAFEVHGLAEGERKVKVEAAKFLALEDKASLPAQGVVTKSFTMRPGFTIAGTVAGPDGKPVAGAKIHATGKSAGGMGGMAAMFGGAGPQDAAATSGDDGKWTADGLPEGPYEVTASADGFLDGEATDVAAGKTDVALTLGHAATFRGRVVSGADLTPAAGAKVKYKTTEEQKPIQGPPRLGGRGGRNMFAALLGASVTCAADGTFEIKGVEPGEYELTGSLKGFADSAAVKVRCPAGQTLDGIEILLPAGVSVAGRVVEASTGAAVADAVVWANSSGGNLFAGMSMSDAAGGTPVAPADAVSARTDSQGQFLLEGLSPGAVNIEVRAADHAPASSPGVAAPSADVLLTIGVGGTVEGRVTGEDGTPVPGAQVMVGRGMGGAGNTARTDSNGDYRVERLPPGKYQLKLVDTKNMMSMFMPGKDSVEVKEGETVRHDFKKKGGAGRQFGGAALRDGKPIPNAMVFLLGGSSGPSMATTDENGRYSFDGLEPGEYTVVLQPNPMSGGNANKKVSVGSSGKIEDVPLELSSATIEGDVVDVATGKGIEMAQIMLTEPGTKLSSSADLMGGVRGRGFTDAKGHFVITDVQNATFTMRVSAGDYVTTTLDGVVAGATDVKIRLSRGVEFLVKVVDAEGRPVVAASVKSVDQSGRENLALDMTMSGFTRDDGTARLRLSPGRYGIDVSADNFLPAHADVDTGAGPATVVLSPGATLEVVAVDAAGAAVVGAKVSVKDAAGKEISRGILMSGFMGGADATDANGRFTRGGLPSGAVIVVVTPPGRDPTAVDATLEANKTKRVDVVVK